MERTLVARPSGLRCAEPLELDTLYLGGTPSHLGPAGLERLFAVLAGKLQPVATAEVTVEANPLDVTDAFVGAARRAGVPAHAGHLL